MRIKIFSFKTDLIRVCQALALSTPPTLHQGQPRCQSGLNCSNIGFVVPQPWQRDRQKAQYEKQNLYANKTAFILGK